MTSKRIVKRWKDRFFMLSSERLLVFNRKSDWEQDRQPKKNIRIHQLIEVGPLYQYKDEAPMVPGPGLVWQFKIRENVVDASITHVPFKFSSVLPIKELCKLGTANRAMTVALRDAVMARVMEKELVALEGSGGTEGTGGQSRGPRARGRYAD